ncbi:hypothetical protein SAMN05192534_10579 [Alteribacillus persepolensis]|uniref:Uncharacterized protein n=1 Tax=Alteribacillus persepolensis TaxID=568899 RepID=A0A1G8C871_9BACI|nr:hypothetical protein [Alteribacillus persepolensis]SDH41070.1 hypothetical protein SAMN05192534_10579 [Alteribacillus persepolensis]
MLVTVEDELIYFYFQEKTSASLPIGTYPDVNGFLLYDKKGRWLGYRMYRTVLGKRHVRVSIPKIRKLDYPIFNASIEDGKEYIEIKFDKDTPVHQMKEQECMLDFNEHGLFGIEVIRKPENPPGKCGLVQKFLEIDG